MISNSNKGSQVLLTLMWFVAKFIVERNAHFQLKVSENKDVNVFPSMDPVEGPVDLGLKPLLFNSNSLALSASSCPTWPVLI